MRSSALAILVFLLTSHLSAAEPVGIENPTLRATVDPSSGSFSLLHKPSKQTFIAAGRLRDAKPTGAVAVDADDPTFGKCRRIEVAYSNGDRDFITLPTDLPFALFASRLHNGGAEAMELIRVPSVSAMLELGKPAAKLRALGTGGLSTPDKNPGSYAWLAVADPTNRAGVVAGWITQDRGSGVLFSPVADEKAGISARIDYGRLRINPGQDAPTETLALGWFDDARLGLEAYADAIARVYRIKLPPQPAGYCTWYAEKNGGACDEKNLALLARFAAEKLKPYGFEFVQIDDSWQAGVSKNGPCRDFLNHRPKGPYPTGMKAAADDVRQQGLRPGIWFMPFAGTQDDPAFRDHLDWFAKDAQGKPFETTWGGTCLDMTQPQAQEHLRQVVRRLRHEWGYTVFKMDGLWTGTATRLMYVNDGYKDDHIGEARLADANKTHIEAYRDGLKLVRREAGPDVFLLGCCVSQNMRSLGGAMGLVDAMRIGPDTGAGEIGAPHGSRNYFLHGRVWYNDPDCVSVRARATLDRARLNATWTAISGQLFYNSDWLPDLPAERLDILRRTLPAHGLPSRPVDLFENEPARAWLLTDTRGGVRRDVLALYNWDSKPVAITLSPSQADLPAGELVGFDFWANRFVPPMREINVTLPPASCRVLALRAVAPHPQLVSTSRHVTQGIVDVRNERWDPQTGTLSGTSRVVANDPYELRIVVPTGKSSWQWTGVILPEGATAEVKRFGPTLRIRFTARADGEIPWAVKFEPAAIELPPPPPVTGLSAAVGLSSVVLVWQDLEATRYRVARNGATVHEGPETRFEDRQAERGKTHRYTVEAIGWTGAVSPPACVEVAVPAEPKRPPNPPKPDIQLSDLKPTEVGNGWGKLGVDRSIEGNPLKLDGKTYARGMGTHAPALLAYPVPAGAQRFVAIVGLDDEKRDDPRASVVFEVYGDVQQMGEKPELLAKSPILCGETLRSWAFDVPLNSRFKSLRLIVTDAGDGMACDHADWVEAGFKK